MVELLQSSFSDNTQIIFTLALFFAAISGQKLKACHRVALVYSFCLLMSYFDIVDFCVNGVVSLIVLFLVFEVFNSDDVLIRLYSFRYKFLDFLFRVFIEFYGWLFYPTLLITAIVPYKHLTIMQMAFAVSVLYIASIVSRRRFAIKKVSDIISQLIAAGGDPASCTFCEEDLEKLRILVYLEDGGYLNRNEKVHIITLRYLLKKLFNRIKIWKGNVVEGCARGFRKLRHRVRGLGTIEMQVLRTVGLEFGSYRLTIRRKLFELLFAQALFNSYINQLSVKSFARDNFKKWLLNCYINLVPVKVGKSVCKPKEKSSTFLQLFEKEFSELSPEEFFVWCLGLPHYTQGVGMNAVEIHKDAVKRFNLEMNKITDSITCARRHCP